MITEEITQILTEKLNFWDKLTNNQKARLIDSTMVFKYEKGRALHFGDFDCVGVLIVKEGIMRTYITSEEGREATLYRLDRGDICILSASCILQTISFDVSIDAETDCEVIQISTSTFAKIAEENIYAELFSYRLATERFSDVMWAMQQLLFTSIDKRLAAFLIDESTKNHSPSILMTHEQIAKNLGTAREVISRMLKQFSHKGYVSLFRGGITIVDKQALKNTVLHLN
ncbi:MAG: Crp/Fnr family transcriptional regulator [Lachnospiraceae bacterium]